jgi:hypothetical protein
MTILDPGSMIEPMSPTDRWSCRFTSAACASAAVWGDYHPPHDESIHMAADGNTMRAGCYQAGETSIDAAALVYAGQFIEINGEEQPTTTTTSTTVTTEPTAPPAAQPVAAAPSFTG